MAMSRWQFVCENENCKHKNYGFVFLCPWPLGSIDAVINSKKVSENNEFKQGLEGLKKIGRNYTCIQYPDVNDIPVIGYRIHLWCDKCANLLEYDIMISEPDKEKMAKEKLCANDKGIIENTIKNSNIPKNCPVCKDILIDHTKIYNKGYITCPSCKTKSMPVPSIWFANEKPVNKTLLNRM